MNVDSPGQFNSANSQTWNLGPNHPGGFNAWDCSVTLEGQSPKTVHDDGLLSADGPDVTLTPKDFLAAATNIVNTCTKGGGSEVLPADNRFKVEVSTRLSHWLI